MNLRKSALALFVALGFLAAPATAADLSFSTGPFFLQGYQPVDGANLNVMVRAINTLNAQAGGTVSGTYMGTFSSLSAPTNGLWAGVGTSSTRYTMGSTADRAVFRVYADSSNATGYARGVESRLYYGGAGGGEAVRAYGIVNNVTAAVGETVNGIHASLQVSGASGAISGAAHAARNTLMLDSGTTAGGTIDVAQFDTVLEGTVPSNAAFLSFDNLGTNKLDYLMRITNPSTTMVTTNAKTGIGMAATLRVLIGGTVYYVPICTNANCGGS